MTQDLSQKVNGWNEQVSRVRRKYDRKRYNVIVWSLVCVTLGGFLVGLACGLYF